MYNSFEERKQQLALLENGRGINYILNKAYQIIGNPMLMIDTSYNLLAHNEGVVTDDRIWNEIIALGTFSHETVDFFKRENFIDVFSQAEIVSFMKSDKLKYDRMNVKLFDKDDTQLASVVVLACEKSFEEGDAELAEILSGILSIELQNSEFYQRIDRVYQESILNKLINGDVVEDKAKKAQLYREHKANLYLAVVDIIQYEHTLTHLAYFRDLFKKMQGEYDYYIHLNYIIIIISTDNQVLSAKKEFDRLHDFFAKYKIYAGVSSRFQDLSELRERYREALNALNYGMNSKRRQYIFKYDNIKVEHFLRRVTTNNIQEICNPVVLLIKEYDRENHTSFLELLYTYLSLGLNRKLVCTQLRIGKKSLKRQLRALNEMFDIEWNDGDMLNNIHLSIKMLEGLSVTN